MLNKLKSFVSSDKFVGPGGKMMSIRSMVSQASSHSREFDRSNDLTELEAALQYNTAAVEAAQLSGHPLLASYHETLAVFHGLRFQKVGDPNDLHLALKHDRASVDSTPVGHPELPRRYQSLAVTYANLFRELDDMDALEAALKYHHLTIDITPASDPALLERKTNLSASYFDRFERLGNSDDLELSLKYDLSVIAAVSDDDPELPRYQASLAVSYGTHFQTFGNLDALQSALKWGRMAVGNTPPGDPALAFRQQNLAICLTRYFERVGHIDDIQSAIIYGRAALNGTPDDHHELAQRQQSLAMSYGALFHRLGSLEDLEIAIKLKQASVDTTPSDHPKLSSRQSNLAASYTDRFRRLEDIIDLELALKYNKAAIKSTPAGHPDLPHYWHCLANSYLDRFQRLQNLDDVEMAMKYSKAALDSTPTDHPDLAGCQQSLAICYTCRHTASNDSDDLDMAIKLRQLAISTMPVDHVDLAIHHSALGMTYLEYFTSQKDINHLKSALHYNLKALEATSSDNATFTQNQQNVAVSYTLYFQELKNKEDLQHALTHFQEATKSSNAPASLWIAAKKWGTLAIENDLPECLDAYTIAFKTLPQLIWIGNSVAVRQDALVKYGIPKLASAAAAASIKFGKSELAVEFLEQGLAVTYRQMLELRDNIDPELTSEHSELFGRLKQVSLHLQGIERDSSKNQFQESYHLLAIERNNLIQEIKKLKGGEDLFSPPSFQKLAVAAKDGPIIIINCAKLRSDAIIILPSPQPSIKVVPLLNVSPKDTKNVLKRLKISLEGLRIQSRSSDRHGGHFQSNYQNSQKQFQEIISWLWTSVVNPVFQALSEIGICNGRIWWCPSGAFTYLPIHAAGINGPFIQSYTSTLDTLIQARKRKEDACLAQVTALGVTKLPNQPHLDLPSVAKELAKITSVVGAQRIIKLENSDCGVFAVLDHMQKASWLHLACHGEQNLAQPLKSGLLLHDGSLQLSQILAKNLPSAQFVFLSACQTAMGDSELVNESMHLAGGFVFAGFKGAVGTLWSIADADGPIVAEMFYQKIFGDKDGVPEVSLAAEALLLAVKRLQSSGVSFERWVPFVHFGV